MAWVKLTDKIHDSDKVGGVSDAAFRLWVLGIAWANDKRTDGHIPSARPVRLLSLRNSEKTIGELLEAKLWHRASSPCASCVKQRADRKADPIPSGGYVIHHYFGDPATGDTYQRPRWQIEQGREFLRELGRRGGEASAQARSATVKRDASPAEEALKRDAQPPRSTATLKRDGQAARSSATLDRTGPYAQAPRSTPGVPGVPGVPGLRKHVPGGAGGKSSPNGTPEAPDEPAIPDEPVRSQERRTTGLHHIGPAASRAAKRAAR